MWTTNETAEPAQLPSWCYATLKVTL
jgi:hypothetical protein